MQVPIFPIRRRRKNRIPLKTGFIHGGGAEGAGGKRLFFLSVNRRLFLLLGKDQVFPAGVMPDHPLMKQGRVCRVSVEMTPQWFNHAIATHTGREI